MSAGRTGAGRPPRARAACTTLSLFGFYRDGYGGPERLVSEMSGRSVPSVLGGASEEQRLAEDCRQHRLLKRL